MGKAKMGHSKFDKFKQQGPTEKRRYKTAGSVCNGYRVIDTQTDEAIFESEYMWDVLDKSRELNTPGK